MDWLTTAKSLPCGSKIKVVHCGNSPSMLISHGEKGYSCHCFRCESPDGHQFVPHKDRSIAEIQRHKQELLEHKSKPPRVPSDFTDKIPPEAAWFFRYGITIEDVQAFNWGYSEFFNRVVMPVYSSITGPFDAVQMRAISPNDKPKYLYLGKPKPDTIWGITDALARAADIIVVEDMLSAIKLRTAGFNSVSILGSDITDGQIQKLIQIQSDPRRAIVMWLDADPAGDKGTKRAIKQLQLQGFYNIKRVTGHIEDPKCYTRDKIREFIESAETCST